MTTGIAPPFQVANSGGRVTLAWRADLTLIKEQL
jgi:hypothetical protein